jgi:hypothetical protein
MTHECGPFAALQLCKLDAGSSEYETVAVCKEQVLFLMC